MSLSAKVLLFGFIFTLFSSFGQRFFLGLFNTSLRNELDITHGQFGSIYATATITSSLILIWFGKKIDEFKLLVYSLIVIISLIVSCIFFSLITNILFLFIAIFLMRFSGQGLMSHTATTTISRFFEKSRGKALSSIWLGLSTAEFILPVLIVFLLSIFSWRTVWQLISVFAILILPFIAFYCIRNITIDSRENQINENSNTISQNVKQWKRLEVIKDLRFYIISLNMLAMPWIITGIFVYQSFLAESKLWDQYVIPKSFMVYSISSIFTLFFSGFLVDKFTSRRLLPFVNIPLLIGLIFLFFFNNIIFSYIFFGLVGISNGLSNVLGSSTWAEIYGVRYIGSIKALTTATMVFSTAFGTALFGFLIDTGSSIETIMLISSLYVIFSLFLLLSIRGKIDPTVLKKT